MFSQGKSLLLKPLTLHHLAIKLIIAISLIIAFSVAIWLVTPEFTFYGYKPFISPLARFYFIVSIILIWLLKFVLLDIDNKKPINPGKNKNLLFLQNRFRDAMSFLKKTTITRNDETFALNELPWYLLIGPREAGKTALVAKSEIKFILQKNQTAYENITINSSEHCDWWITPDANIVDIPSRYCHLQTSMKKEIPQTDLYRYFLELSKQERGQNAIAGILLALPLPEILKSTDQKSYSRLLHNTFQILHETKKIFNYRINVMLVITKCDLLEGFNEFFSEPSREEVAQAWGIQLPGTPQRRIQEIITTRFNALIKKLNQQLLWRLHHERDPFARPAIKDFPLQVERLKECILDFIRKYGSLQGQFPLQGIYLTSAMQKNNEEDQTIIVNQHDNEYKAMHEVKLFESPNATSRPYFIKQLLLQGLKPSYVTKTDEVSNRQLWIRLASYGVATILIGAIAFYLGKDFELGLSKVYTVKNDLYDYRLAIKTTQNPEQQLLQTSELLNTLEARATATTHNNLNVSQLFKFYSYKSQLNVNNAYLKALQNILLPSLRNYLADNLKQPTNESPTLIYGILKSYLMLGDPAHIDVKFIVATLNQLPLKLFSNSQRHDLYLHINSAFTQNNPPIQLNDNIIKDIRKYLTGLPTLKLAMIILKNSRANDGNINLNLLNSNQSIFTSVENIQPIPNLYTRKNFSLAMEGIPTYVNEAIHGNWIIGMNANSLNNVGIETQMTNDLRELFIKDYTENWENLVGNLQLSNIDDLNSIDNLIIRITGNESPFLKLLQIIHLNTYFEPILSASPRLYNMGLLIEKSRENNNLLYQIFATLKSLHLYLRPIVNANNTKKASFDLVSTRMKNQTSLDAITQLRVIANKSPEPINTWLLQLSDETWNLLMKNASQYIDISWHNVIQNYQASIANRFPFNNKAKTDVKIDDFIKFFGYPGIVTSYFDKYLQPFVDTSTENWHWKILDNRQIFLSEEKLRQIQYALKIHRTFFPNHDDKLNLQFSLQPYQFSKDIQSVKLKIDDKELIGNKKDLKTSQAFTWPTNISEHNTSLQLKLTNKIITKKNYSGDWGIFKLINQYFETAVSKKQMVINFSANNQTAKYLLITEGQYNPFMSFNLNHFNLPDHLN